MSITLSQLTYGCDKTYDMQLTAGQGGTGCSIKWVHIVEDTEATDFFHGNELVLVTGIGQQNQDPSKWLLKFAEKLTAKNAGGLVINIGPYIKKIPENLTEFCNNNNFPLYTVPWRIHLVDLTYDLCHRIIANEEAEIGLAAAFRNLIFTPDDEKSYVPVLERRGFHDDDEYMVCSAKLIEKHSKPFGQDYLQLRSIVQKVFARESRQLNTFTQDECLIVVFRGLEPSFVEEKINLIADRYCDENSEFDTRIGLSGQEFGYRGISSAYHRSMSALRVARIKNERVMRYADTGSYRLLLDVSSGDTLRQFYTDVLGKLASHDDRNSAEYMSLLKDYLMSDCSVQEVAAKNNLHRNTVNYQIKRIREILGMSFDTEDKLNILLAFYIGELLETA